MSKGSLRTQVSSGGAMRKFMVGLLVVAVAVVISLATSVVAESPRSHFGDLTNFLAILAVGLGAAAIGFAVAWMRLRERLAPTEGRTLQLNDGERDRLER